MIQAGAGLWGASWTRVVSASPHWDLVAVADPDPAARSATPARAFASLTEAIREVEADAVLIVAPPAAHGPLALEALEGGLHCLVEKPLAPSIGEARDLVKRAVAADRILMASQNYRFRSGYRTVAGLVRDGSLGEPGFVQVVFGRTPLFTGFRLELEDPLLVDQAVHHLDLARALLPGHPEEVRARSFNPSWSPFRGDASGLVDLRMDTGAVVAYSGTWAPRGPETEWDGDWTIHCEGGSIRWSGSEVRAFPAEEPAPGPLARRLRKPGHRVPPVRLEESDRAGVLAELAAAIAEGREPETSGRDNLQTLEVVFGAVESARTGTPVRLA